MATLMLDERRCRATFFSVAAAGSGLLCWRSLTGSVAVNTNGTGRRTGSSGPRPEARRRSLNSPSQEEGGGAAGAVERDGKGEYEEKDERRREEKKADQAGVDEAGDEARVEHGEGGH